MPKYQEFRIPSFAGGYNGQSQPSQIGDNQVATGSLNVRFRRDGAAEKRLGYRKVLSDAGESWTGDYTETLAIAQYYNPDEGMRTLVRVSRNDNTNDVRYEVLDADIQTVSSNWDTDPDGAGSSLMTVTTGGAYADTESFLGDLFVACPGHTGVQKIAYASATWSDSTVSVTGTTPAPSSGTTLNKPRIIVAWYDRLWVAQDPTVDNGSWLYYSNVTGSQFDLANDYQEIVGEGPITGMARLGSNLLVFKRKSIQILSGGDDPTNNLRVRVLSSDVGSVNHRMIVEAEGWLYFLSERGFYRTDGSDVQYIGGALEEEMRDVVWTYVDGGCAVHNRNDFEIVFFINISGVSSSAGWGNAWGNQWGGDANSRVAFTYSYQNKIWSAPYTNQPFICATTFTNSVGSTAEDEEVVVVASDAADYHIYQWNYGETDDGTYTAARLITRPFDLGDPGIVKIVRKLYLRLGEVGSDGSYVPVKASLYNTYGRVTSAVAASTATQQLTQGSDDNPQFTDTRHTVGCIGRNIAIKFEDYNDGTESGGNWILQEIVALFTVKGRRT